MPLSPNRRFPRRLSLTAGTLVVHILTVCFCQAQSASVSSVYSHSQFSHPREQFTNAFKETVGDVRTSLKTHADNFDVFFRDLLMLSHQNFDKMFKETYGILYDRHSSIFNDMFRDLELYYTTGSIDLTLAMKQFFSLLYKKMFEELNSQYAFDSAYLNCTVEHMEEMMPFGELPQKLILQIKRSFIAIRTFVQALNYGNDVLKTIMEVPFTNSCENRLRSISYCRNCAAAQNNLNSLCQDTCSHLVDKACFPYSANLNREWNIYVNDIAKLANRLKTSFNIELAVKPMNIQVSDAIMTFQENGATISTRLFSKCGKPGLKRPKRNAYIYGKNQRLPAKPSYPTSPPRTTLTMEYLIGDILKDFKSYKNFWLNISRNLCSQYSNSQSNCHNQTQRNAEPLNYRDKNNVEIINQQIATLKLISTNVINAYNGLDVDLENNLKLIENGNGNAPVDDEISGSGEEELSGSGNEPITDSPDRESFEQSTTSNGFYFTSTVSSTIGIESTTTKSGQTTGGTHRRQPSSANCLTGSLQLPLLSLALSALVLHKLLLVDYVL